LFAVGLVGAAVLPYAAAGQQPSERSANAAALPEGVKELTVERIFAQPSLSGRLTRGIEWMPDGKSVSFLDSKGEGRGAKTELWAIDAATGARRLLVSAEKLESVTPANNERGTQATGLGRRAPGQYRWAPGGEALLLQGATSLGWFDLNAQSGHVLVSGKDRIVDPKISPDGKYVSFVRDHNLWLVGVSDGKERAVTQGGTEGVRKGELDWVYPEELAIGTAYWWAPDSSAIAYFEMDQREVAQYPLVDFKSYSGEADDERYPPAGGENPVVRVLVAPVAGGEPRVMDTGADKDVYIARVNWLMDSKHVAIQRLNREQNVLDLLFADAATGASRVTLTERDKSWINISDDLRFLKDGKRFLWSSERSGYRHLYLYGVDGKEIAQLTKGEWEVAGVSAVDEAKSVVYFTAMEKSPMERHLYRVGLDGSGFKRITKEDGTHGINFAPDASGFVDTYSNNMTPQRQDLYRVDGTRTAVIDENRVDELAAYHLSPVDFVSVKAHDGAQLNAMMIKPPGFDPSRKYPVIVYTYGGPHAQVVTNAWGGNNFLWHQQMAQKGFIIFALDNRGSAGRGHVFEEPLHLRLGAIELSDQRDGAAYLKSLPYVDGERIGVWGWSYGGHMTLHLMFEAGDIFKVGFAGGPVTDWKFYDTIYTERYLGLPQKNASGYEDSSPVKYAGQLKGKLMIAHGTGDDNVHFANTLEVLDKLIDAGKYVEMLPFPGRGHGVGDPAARRVLQRRVTQFFLDNL
jgi:dipeptidyl-peptidase-4